MDDSVSPFEYREDDCSGRSLATLLVAWVSAAMVASILLRWKYMWIALAILTLLFLLACGYAACITKRPSHHDTPENRIVGDENRRRMEIQSISGQIAACQNSVEQQPPPAYQTYWITDLPPPTYAAVIANTDGAPSFYLQQEEGEQRQNDNQQVLTLANPPPYSVTIEQGQSISTSILSNHSTNINQSEK